MEVLQTETGQSLILEDSGLLLSEGTMALTLAQKDALAVNTTFLARVRQAVAEYAAYLIALPGTAPQLAWANTVFAGGIRRNQIAANLTPELVCNPTVSDSTAGDGSDITDANLKTAVEAVCLKYT